MSRIRKYSHFATKESKAVHTFQEENAQCFLFLFSKLFTICKRNFRMFLQTEPGKELNVSFFPCLQLISNTRNEFDKNGCSQKKPCKTNNISNKRWKGDLRKAELQPPWLRGLLQKKGKTLRPNANAYLQQGLEVTYQQEAGAAEAKIRLLEVFCSHQYGHSNVF